MHLTELRPATLASHDITMDAGRQWLRGTYALAAERYLRLNMITALTGSAVGADGTSDTLTSRVDRTVLGIIRDHADAVLVGAGSVRAEGYVVPRTARLVVLTATGDLAGHRLDASAERVVLVCPSDRVDAVRDRAALAGAEIIGAGAGARLVPERVLEALAQRGLRRVVCEGGPAVASLFAEAGLIDEYCLTVAPALQPSVRPFLHLSEGVSTEVAGMLVDEASFSYLRLRPQPRVPVPATTP